MKLPVQQESPEYIINCAIPDQAALWLQSVQPPPYADIFGRFLKLYRVIEITAGRPNGDYGQTVWLTNICLHIQTDLSNSVADTPIPEHLIGENLPFKPTEMAGIYRYRCTTEIHQSDRPAIVEEFFFPYAQGHQPKSFTDVAASLNLLRNLSTITHKLDLFKVMLMEKGVYVRLKAFIEDSGKPPFQMDS